MGLGIIRRIVEAHGGKVWVGSLYPENSSGNRFSFTLPKQLEKSRRQQ
ncbi:hypothetical protein ACFLTP_08875 [Chloroflexota bacterium]